MYGHLLEGATRSAADKLDDLILPYRGLATLKVKSSFVDLVSFKEIGQRLGVVLDRPNYYGFDPPRTADAFRDAPRTDPAGGTVYFDRNIAECDFATMLRVMGIHDAANAFAAFESEAADPAASAISCNAGSCLARRCPPCSVSQTSISRTS